MRVFKFILFPIITILVFSFFAFLKTPFVNAANITVTQEPDTIRVNSITVSFEFTSPSDADFDDKKYYFMVFTKLESGKFEGALQTTDTNTKVLKVDIPIGSNTRDSTGKLVRTNKVGLWEYELVSFDNRDTSIAENKSSLYKGYYQLFPTSNIGLGMYGNQFSPNTNVKTYIRNAVANVKYGLWFEGSRVLSAEKTSEGQLVEAEINVGGMNKDKDGNPIPTRKRICVTEVGNITVGALSLTCHAWFDILVTDNPSPTPTTMIEGALVSIPTPTSTPTSTPTPTPFPPPCSEYKDGKCVKLNTGLGIPISTDPTGFIKSLFGILLSLSGGIALILIIVSGYQLMTSQGNPEKVQAAKETLTSAIVGLLFIIFSMVILQIIGVTILEMPGFNK